MIEINTQDDQLTFTAGEASAAIKLSDLLNDGDAAALLAYGSFMQLNAIRGILQRTEEDRIKEMQAAGRRDQPDLEQLMSTVMKSFQDAGLVPKKEEEG